MAASASEAAPTLGHVLEHMTIGGGIAVLGVCLFLAVAAFAFFRAVGSF